MAYETWSKEALIARLTELEAEKESAPRKYPWKTFDFSSYPRRKIALKFCYSGWAYNGLAIQLDPTPLPTVEGVLFEALAKARLIDRDAGLEGCGWERCGRTDRGVSAGGQVISLWHNYTLVLNRILPSTIRILAWSPVAPDFSSRFACTSRHYKYFFAPDGLDIPRMSEAASLLVGGHDFRNFCKLDPTKQLTTYRRRIISADIKPVAGGTAVGMHVLDLKGSAFLYHQVRHIMAILFLIGAGLEPPSVVTALLNVEVGAEGDPSLPVVDTRPEYQMADALPLMLYECHYSPGDVKWQAEQETDAELGAGLFHQMHSIQARSELFAALNREFLTAAAAHHVPPTSYLPLTATGFVPDGKTPMNVPLGGAEFRRSVKYTPLLQRNRGDHFEVVNERWRVGKGARRDERRKLLEDDGDE
ncbi:pseudouridine synthase [Mycena alexandri]|uniref:tRNA pseudouridine synthase n=1 Tax=Mycena alexandri TaxID=1745969 RepID=A0AAD6XDE2_9AGAR|nr:pseudouridine synthase [Mycena alexandri]